MTLNSVFPYNNSFKVHIFIGIILGLLLAFILIALQPFNINNFNHNYGEVLLMGFGFVKFVNYLSSHFLGNLFYKKKKKWTLWNEIIFLVLSLLSGTVLGYIYLDTIFEKQQISFLRLILFFYYIVLPISPLIIFPKAMLRYLLNKNSSNNTENNSIEINNKKSETIILKGKNANDKLTILKEQLLYVKSVDNYIMVFFTDSPTKNKMLRANLSDILEQIPFLIQPHRSYLVNPKHLFKIKGNSQKATLISEQIDEDIPIARASYKTIKNIFN